MRRIGNSYWDEPRMPRSRSPWYFRYSPFKMFGGIIALFFLVFVISSVGYVILLKNSEREVTFTVLGKDSVTVSSGSGDSLSVDNEYRVYTTEGTFKVTDTLIYGRFNSADTYGKLQNDHTYTCKVAGWRFGLFSWFPNLIKCREV